MHSSDTQTNGQRLLANAEFHELQMWRAAETVRRRTPEGADRDELLECLGLTDAQAPVSG
jgi:hypothetical protein